MSREIGLLEAELLIKSLKEVNDPIYEFRVIFDRILGCFLIIKTPQNSVKKLHPKRGKGKLPFMLNRKFIICHIHHANKPETKMPNIQYQFNRSKVCVSSHNYDTFPCP